MPPTPEANAPALILVAGAPSPRLTDGLDRQRYAVADVRTGAQAVAWARDLRPDAILLNHKLSDMSGLEASRLLQDDLQIDHRVPILLLAPEKPAPEDRVAALGAGAWDYLLSIADATELMLRIDTFIQAKRNLDVALADQVFEPRTGMHTRAGLVRRARELGALMARKHGALACVAFALEVDSVGRILAGLLVRAARVSDAVGWIGPGAFAVVAPATDGAGAVKLALRVREVLQANGPDNGLPAIGTNLRAGYDAVANVRYAPIDPLDLLSRAMRAVRGGKAEAEHHWLRRFTGANGDEDHLPRTTPQGIVSSIVGKET